MWAGMAGAMMVMWLGRTKVRESTVVVRCLQGVHAAQLTRLGRHGVGARSPSVSVWFVPPLSLSLSSPCLSVSDERLWLAREGRCYGSRRRWAVEATGQSRAVPGRVQGRREQRRLSQWRVRG